jgi:response regulator RpfG family c-di-GMP phosphodiesterase
MPKTIQILLADDDMDDRFFFNKAIDYATVPASLITVENGEKLMRYLSEISPEDLPDALFLDLNMPKKNGSECLREIKNNENLKRLPVIIYSTSLHPEIADLLYRDGAHYYIKKTDLVQMQTLLNYVLKLVNENQMERPDRENFILSSRMSILS